MTQEDTASDIPRGGWVGRAPPALRPHLRLMRLDRPIGIWLLLLPCLWGLVLAPHPGGLGWPDLRMAVLFAAGAVLMRGAGCVVNDILDRDIDARVARTRTRPLPAGEIGVPGALALLALLLAVSLAVLLAFNRTTVLLGAASLVLVATYPLMKRVTWWPQAFLGLTFNWGALMGWTAVTGTLGLPALLLYAGAALWTLGYDTIYAHQDREDDALAGVRSTARRLGAASPHWVAGFYAGALCLIAAAGLTAGLAPLFLARLLLPAVLLARQLRIWRMDDPASALAAFRANRDVGLAVLAALLAGRVLA